MGLSNELLAEIVSPLMEAGPSPVGSESAIGSAWIKGIRASWKKVTDAARRVAGANRKAQAIDFELIPNAAKDCLAALGEVTSYVRALRADLLINKNMWSSSSVDDAKKSGNKAALLRAKVVAGLDKADEELADARGKIEFWWHVLADTSSHDYQMSGGSHRREAEQSLEAFQRYLNSIGMAASAGVIGADAEISRGVLKDLSSAILKVQGRDSTEKTEYPIDFGSSLPDVVRVGDVTLIFSDGPAAGDSPGKPRAGWHQDYAGGSVRDAPRPPVLREKYLGNAKEAWALLKRRGLGHLWYGRIVIMCPSCGGQNPHGASFGVGAHYHRQGDWISIYADPNRKLPYLIAHEMGHRYYYKFMSASDRAAFDRWFGTVKATSAYGGSATEEDWAEVFASYVDGTDLDRDQLARFKVFIGKKRKLEQARRPLEQLVKS